MQNTLQTNSAQETQAIAKKFANKLHPGDIVLLYGNLGAGKTTFTQGLAKGLGITRRIISPTFILMRTYEMANAKTFYHVDLYRLEKDKEIEGIGFIEKIGIKDSIIVIEWPEKLQGYVPKKRWEIHIEDRGGEKREIQVIKYA